MQYPWNWEWNFNWIRRINDESNLKKLSRESKQRKIEIAKIAEENRKDFIKRIAMLENKSENEIVLLQLQPKRPINKVCYMFWEKEKKRQMDEFEKKGLAVI